MEMVLIFTFCLILAGTDAVTTVTGYRGRSVQIKCYYTSGYEKNNKYLCRGKCPTWDLIDVPVQSGSPDKDPRFSLYDDTTAKVFTVTITDLTTRDEGTYWCGIEQIGYDKYTEILLLVKTDAPTISAVSYTTHTTSTQSMSPSVHAENTHSSSTNPLNDDNNTVSLPRISISPIISAVSVVPVLLLFVLLIIITIQRKKKTRGPQHQNVQNPRSLTHNQTHQSVHLCNVSCFPQISSQPGDKIFAIYHILIEKHILKQDVNGKTRNSAKHKKEWRKTCCLMLCAVVTEAQKLPGFQKNLEVSCHEDIR
ncbi:CMRF35-like molecule 9 [Clarias gariepinus]|uniref:CMRF35-like molecule 9 n=1 Tax=Clarias gariepinus TaxID=13013 RepID=UPI00234C949A|nr:CMRF35-like molecule 9 [Clarias gariepinus]